jgi:hypothetical protein
VGFDAFYAVNIYIGPISNPFDDVWTWAVQHY